jgi:hypothetical protein
MFIFIFQTFGQQIQNAKSSGVKDQIEKYFVFGLVGPKLNF